MLKINKDEWEFLKFKRLFEVLVFYLSEGFFMYLFLKEKNLEYLWVICSDYFNFYKFNFL